MYFIEACALQCNVRLKGSKNNLQEKKVNAPKNSACLCSSILFPSPSPHFTSHFSPSPFFPNSFIPLILHLYILTFPFLSLLRDPSHPRPLYFFNLLHLSVYLSSTSRF